MTIDRTEMAALIVADHGETLHVNGREFIGTLVLGVVENEVTMAGEEKRTQARISWITGAIDVNDGDVIRRDSDNTRWRIMDKPDARNNGMTVAVGQQTAITRRGKF